MHRTSQETDVYLQLGSGSDEVILCCLGNNLLSSMHIPVRFSCELDIQYYLWKVSASSNHREIVVSVVDWNDDNM